VRYAPAATESFAERRTRQLGTTVTVVQRADGAPEPAERTLEAELGPELLHRVGADVLLVLEDLDDLLADCGIRCHRLLLVMYVGRIAQVDGRTPETKNPRGSPSAILAVSETKLACRGHIEAEEDNRS
jgi:hypothetical protein